MQYRGCGCNTMVQTMKRPRFCLEAQFRRSAGASVMSSMCPTGCESRSRNNILLSIGRPDVVGKFFFLLLARPKVQIVCSSRYKCGRVGQSCENRGEFDIPLEAKITYVGVGGLRLQ